MAKNENEPSLSTLVSSSGTIKKSHIHNSTQPGHHHHHHHHRHRNPSNNCAPSISTEANSADSLNSVSTTGSSITSAGLGMAGTPTPTTHNNITKMKCPARIQSYQQQQQQRHRSHHHGNHHRSSSRGHHRQNVAIATQVISPSAIGGSLKLSGPRRICQHYDIDAEDDDSDGTGLFGRKKTLPWGKLSCYGASIGIIILIMTGVVLAVGYMQSEKQRIMSQSQKLSQEWNNTHPAPTTWRPKLTFHRTPNVSVTIPDADTSASSPPNIMTRLRFSSKIAAANDSATNITDSIDEDVANLGLASNNAETKLKESIPSKEMVSKGQERESQEDSDESDEDDDDDDEDEGDELEIYEPKVGLLGEQSRTQESRNGEQAPSEITRAMSRMDNNDILQLQQLPLLLPTQPLLPVSTTSPDNSKVTENEERHKSPSEVKVLPPKDFKFNGYSFEIPIYTQNSSTFAVGNSNSSSSETNQQSTLPPFIVLSDTIHPTSKSLIPDTHDSTSTVQLQKFDIGNPLQVDLDDNFNSTNPNPDSNPYVLKGNFNYTNSNFQSNSHIDTTPTTNEENFEALKKFLDSFKPAEEESVNEASTDIDNKLPATGLTPNSFNIGSSSPTNLQTDLFSSDDDEGDVNNALSPNSEDDADDDTDSEMSASNDKVRGRNHRPPKVKIQPQDNMYTPRPGSNPYYPDRPPRLYSAKTNYNLPSKNLFPGSNKNDATTGDYNQNSNSYSDFGSYELASTPVTSSKSIKQSTDVNGKVSSSTSSGFQPLKFDSSEISNSIQTGKNNHETTTISTLSVSDFQLSSPPTPISLNLYNSVTASPYSASTDSSNFHFDFSQLTTPSPLHGATPTPNFPDVLSKRTFNFGYDSSGYGGGSTSNFNSNNNNYNNNHNPFSDILGSQSSITSSIGSATPTGASLGYNANYNFDSFNPYINTGSGGSNSNPNSNFPSGTIPLDLASSYIQAGNPGGNRGGGNSNNNNPGGFNLQASGSSSLNNYDFSSPYGSTPGSGPISLSQLIQNSADHGTRNSGYTSPGTLTTSSNQVPQYNTITQGIHLLSLLHGNIPEHLSDNYQSASNNDYGQHINQQYADNPQFQLAGLTGYSGGHGGGNSNNNAYSNNLQSSSSNYNPYIVAAESRNLHTSGSGRHDVSSGPADQQTSFSQNIVAKLADFSNINKKHVADSISASSDSVPTVVAESQAVLTEKKLSVPAAPQNLKSNEKIPDMDTAASEILLISSGRTDPSNNAVVSEKSIKPSINFAKKLAKVRRVAKEESDINERGLKSGFYI